MLTSPAEEQLCSMTLLERLIRTSSIWFLPDIGRSGAVHYLQGKDIGNFIVRQSSKKGTLALSVRLPLEAGPYIEHYLIEATPEGKHRLEGSDNHFASVPVLICHYCQCCDELPAQLRLPAVLMHATTRQELSSFSLLGQDLWVSSVLKSVPSTLGSTASSATPPPTPLTDHNANVQTNSFRQATTATTPTSSSTVPDPPQPSIAVRPSFLPLHSFAAPTPKPVPLPRVVCPPPTSRSTAQQSPPCVSELAGRSAFYVGSGRPRAQSDTKEIPRCLASEAKETSRSSTREKKSSTRRRRVSIAESSPETYYCSSLADKVSDYEDIWGNAKGVESPQSCLSTFKPNFDSQRTEAAHLSADNKAQKLVCQATQTEIRGSCLPEQLGEAGESTPSRLSRSMPRIADRAMEEDQAAVTKKVPGHFSSPFYAEPVDSLFFGMSTDVAPLRIDEDSISEHRDRKSVV